MYFINWKFHSNINFMKINVFFVFFIHFWILFRWNLMKNVDSNAETFSSLDLRCTYVLGSDTPFVEKMSMLQNHTSIRFLVYFINVCNLKLVQSNPIILHVWIFKLNFIQALFVVGKFCCGICVRYSLWEWNEKKRKFVFINYFVRYEQQ